MCAAEDWFGESYDRQFLLLKGMQGAEGLIVSHAGWWTDVMRSGEVDVECLLSLRCGVWRVRSVLGKIVSRN